MIRINLWILLFFCFLMPLTLSAQAEMSNVAEPRSIRIVWKGVEHVWRYSVEIQKLENGSYSNYLQEFTASTVLNVTLLPGEYRFRITTHDILDRPGEPTAWKNFEVHKVIINENILTEDTKNDQQFEEIKNFDEIDNTNKKITENKERSEVSDDQLTENIERINYARFNTAGASLGTAFTDPLVILTLHGTYAPINNFFIEIGCDVGFVSVHENVNSFYSIYPYANLCYYLPFENKIGIFAGAGAGYILGSYNFSHGGNADLNIFTFNFTAGVSINNFINISYSLRTNFAAINHQIAVGYDYRFRQE